MGCDTTSKQDNLNFREAPARRSTLGAQWLAANYLRAPVETIAERLRAAQDIATQDMATRARLATQSRPEQAADEAAAPASLAPVAVWPDDRPVWQRLAPIDSWTLPFCEQLADRARAASFALRQIAAAGGPACAAGDGFAPPWRTTLELHPQRAAGAVLTLALIAGLWTFGPRLTPDFSIAPKALQAAGGEVGALEPAVAAPADLANGAATAFALTPAPPGETWQKSETLQNITNAAAAVSNWAGRFAAAASNLVGRAIALPANARPPQSAASLRLAPRAKTKVSAIAPSADRHSIVRRAAATLKPPVRPVTDGAAAVTPFDQITHGIDVAGTGAQSGLTNLVIGVRRLLAPQKRGGAG